MTSIYFPPYSVFATVQNAQRAFTDLDPKDPNNKIDATTYGTNFGAEDILVQTVQKTNKKFAEIIASAGDEMHSNFPNMGMMCPIGIENHDKAQLTLQCPPDKPIRCSHATVVDPAAGTCAYHFDKNNNPQPFTGKESHFANFYNIINSNVKDNCDKVLDSECRSLVNSFANKNGYDFFAKENEFVRSQDASVYYEACKIGPSRFPDILFEYQSFLDSAAQLTPANYAQAQNCKQKTVTFEHPRTKKKYSIKGCYANEVWQPLWWHGEHDLQSTAARCQAILHPDFYNNVNEAYVSFNNYIDFLDLCGWIYESFKAPIPSETVYKKPFKRKL